MPARDAPAAFLGDAHLREEDDPEVGAFVRFCDALPAEIRTLGILGDLFAVWIGRAELQGPHHREVLAALRRLRDRGCAVLYVEGNHDFEIAPRFAGDPFDAVAARTLDVRLGGRSLHLAHGDLVNRRDHPYRLWRAVSKSRPFLGAFHLLPSPARLRLAAGIERRMAATNLRHKARFPLQECAAYARARLATGTEAIVFGHFHEERRLDYDGGGRRGSVYVLPAWREGHRYLRIDPGREPVFVSS
jgi:UDP-2,3-diacylglucosamine hydrolase